MRATASILATVVLAGIAALGAGCGGPCKEVAVARQRIEARPAPSADAHARVQVPYAVANAAIAGALVEPPQVPVRLRRLGPLAHLVGPLTAVPRELRLVPAPPGLVGIELSIELRDGAGELLTLAAHAEVAPELEHDGDDAFLRVGIDPARVDGVELDLGDRAVARLGDVLTRRLPGPLRGRVPAGAVDAVAAAVVEELGEETWAVLRTTLLPRLGALSQVRVRLPDLPIASVAVRSRGGGVPALDLAIVTSLPVRAGLGALTDDAPGDVLDPGAVDVRLAGSTVTELGNWAVATGRAPRRYTRALRPAADGDYVPNLDWRPGHRRPLVVSVFQVARGCSCFSVGARARIEVRSEHVVGTIEERRLELALAAPHLELAAWLKDAVDRWFERSRRAAAHTQLTVGGRVVAARLVHAAVDAAQLRVVVELDLAPA